MSDHAESQTAAPDTEPDFTAEDFGHPRGTLAIVLIYGLIFAGTWLGLYIWQFLGRGAPTP